VIETIFVSLPNDGSPAWAPVKAERVGPDIWRIVDCLGEDDELQFGKGSLVRCQTQVLTGDLGRRDECLVAFEAVE